MEVDGYLTLNVSHLHLGKYPLRSGQVNPAIITSMIVDSRSKCILHLSVVGQLHVDVTTRIHALSLVEADCADAVVIAAAGGDLGTLINYLKKHPDQVRPCTMTFIR